MYLISAWQLVFLMLATQTITQSPARFSNVVEYTREGMMVGNRYVTSELPCKPCCETRTHGELVVLADVTECIFSSSIAPTSMSPPVSTPPPSEKTISITQSMSMPTISDLCTPCCETRTHGQVVIIVSIDQPDKQSTYKMYGVSSQAPEMRNMNSSEMYI